MAPTAGIEGPIERLENFPEDAFERVLKVNVTGVFLGMKYVLPKMRDGGSVIITSSIAGLRASPNFVAYNASKHAVVGIMRTAAAEVAPRKIRVNTIHPAGVEGAMVSRLEQGMARVTNMDVEATRQYLKSRVPLGRYCDPDEIAATVVFLGSDDSRMITGSVVSIDGGSVMY
jgi:NAD(P)-dependent dehydrogenase (short-subunit alcohol dehydrogenase family)